MTLQARLEQRSSVHDRQRFQLLKSLIMLSLAQKDLDLASILIFGARLQLQILSGAVVFTQPYKNIGARCQVAGACIQGPGVFAFLSCLIQQTGVPKHKRAHKVNPSTVRTLLEEAGNIVVRLVEFTFFTFDIDEVTGCVNAAGIE